MKKLLSFFLLTLTSCSQNNEETMTTKIINTNLDSAVVKKIASKKIYFGHQSVGYNIIDGLKAIIPDDSGINIVESSDPNDFSKPVFAHSQNGENTKPETKIADFVQKMDAGLGNKVDIACFKFCYVDIYYETDVKKLFNEYTVTMNSLIKKYPHTTFLHFTVPLTTEDEGIKNKMKSIIKSLIGRKTGDRFDNIKRMEFNILLRKEYRTKVLDIAKFESSTIDGKELLSNKGGVNHQVLLKAYTDDGGHLNRNGQILIVQQLLKDLNL